MERSRRPSRTTVLSGPGTRRLRTTDDWLGPDGKKVCEDERVLTIYQAGTTRILDFDIDLKATAGPSSFGDTKEGMFGLRVASSMDVDREAGGKITNAEGLTDDQGLGQGLALGRLHRAGRRQDGRDRDPEPPRSFRYPTTWHVRTYGLFAANPFGWHDFGLENGRAHAPGGYELSVRLPRDPARGRHCIASRHRRGVRGLRRAAARLKSAAR